MLKAVKIFFLTATILLLLVGLAHLSQAQANNPQLLHLWHFDEDFFNKDAITQTQMNLYGPDPEVLVPWTEGRFDKGIDFNEVGAYAFSDIPDISDQELTIEFWIKTDQHYINKYGWIFCASDTGPECRQPIIQLVYDGAGQTRLEMTANVHGYLEPFVSGYRTLDDGNWHYIVATIDMINDQWVLYVDGELLDQKALAVDFSSVTSIMLANNPGSPGESYTGDLDELTMWKGILTPQEILSHYQFNQPRPVYIQPPTPITPEIQYLWHFDENTGTKVIDEKNQIEMDLIGPTDWTEGKFDKGIDFNEVSAYAFSDIPDISDKELTIEFWIKTDQHYINKYGWIFCASDTGPECRQPIVQLVYDEVGQTRLEMTANVRGYLEPFVSGQKQMDDNQWHYVVSTIDMNRDKWKLYIDGQLLAEKYLLVDFSSVNSIMLANNPSSPGESYTGDLDELAIWKGILNSQDIQEYYQSNEPREIEPPVTIIDVAVILAEPSDVDYEATSILAQPCKLIPEKTYQNGHSEDYYKDLAYCVNDYYKENSYGSVQFNFEVFPDHGAWYPLTRSTSDYVPDEREFVKDALDKVSETETNFSINNYDIIIAIHAGPAARYTSEINTYLQNQTWTPAGQPGGSPPYKIIISEDGLVGVWTHELGHVLGALVLPAAKKTMVPDVYDMGNVEFWDLMALGSLSENGMNPPFMSSYIKEFLEWLNYNIHPKSDYGEHLIDSLTTAELNDSVFRYNLEDSINSDIQKYYILESRNKNLKTWDSSFPENKVLVLYYVDEDGFPEYGYDDENSAVLNQSRHINIPKSGVFNINDGVLSPLINETYKDFDNLVKFTAKSDNIIDDKYQILADIQPIIANSLEDRVGGVILRPTFDLSKQLRTFILNNQILNESISLQEPIIESRLFIKAIIKNIQPSEYRFRGTNQSFQLEILKARPVKAKSGYLIELEKGEIIEVLVSEYYFPNQNFNIGDVVYMEIVSGGDTDFDGYVGYFTESISDTNPAYAFYVVVIIFLILFGLAILIFIKLRDRLKPGVLKKILLFFILIVTIFLMLSLLFLGHVFWGGKHYNIWASSDKGKMSSISKSMSSSISAPLLDSVFFDLDLHLYTDDGKHIGMNYETSEYEIQVEGAVVSGDNQGSPEWIFIPENITDYHFVVSSYDNQKFLEDNPEIAQQLEDVSDSYDIYARYIDPVTDIYTSAIISEEIEPDELLEHQVTGTEDITVLPAQLFDITPPTTSISLSDSLGQNNWYLSDVLINLTAVDNENGTGVDKTDYSFDNQTWQTYLEPFTISDEGIHTLYYRSIDNAGNIEEIKSIEINIDKTLPEITAPVFAGSYIYKQSLVIEFSALDAVSGIASISATLNNQPITSGQEVILNQLSTNVFTITAVDYAGHSKTETREFKVFYDFSGFLPSLQQDKTYNSGRGLPVKFQLKDAQGNYVTTVQPRIYIAEFINGEAELEQPAISSGKADIDNIARYDQNEDQYIFNLSTKDLSSGQYQIRADLVDESMRIISVKLKKVKNN